MACDTVRLYLNTAFIASSNLIATLVHVFCRGYIGNCPNCLKFLNVSTIFHQIVPILIIYSNIMVMTATATILIAEVFTKLVLLLYKSHVDPLPYLKISCALHAFTNLCTLQSRSFAANVNYR